MKSILLIFSIFLAGSWGMTDCQRQLIESIHNSTYYTKTYLESGKYINELGNFDLCEANENFTYTLAILSNDQYKFDTLKRVWGMCFTKACNGSELKPIGLLISAANNSTLTDSGLMGNATTEYILPKFELEEYQ